MQPLTISKLPPTGTDRESVLQALFLRRPSPSSIITLLSNQIWRGRISAAEAPLYSAQFENPLCPELKILSVHKAVLSGRALLAFRLVEEALKSHDESQGLWLYWGYIASLGNVIPHIPSKSDSLARVMERFKDNHEAKAVLTYLIQGDKESASDLSLIASKSDSEWVQYLSLTTISPEKYSDRKASFQKFSERKLTLPPLFAASVLVEMLANEDYQTLSSWFQLNPTLCWDYPAIGVIKFIYELLQGQQENAKILKDRLTEQTPDPEVTGALFFGSEKAELFIPRVLITLENASRPGLKLLADLLFDLRLIEQAGTCYQMCTLHYPDDSVIRQRYAYCESYKEADPDVLESLFAKALDAARTEKDRCATFSLMGEVALRKRDYEGAVLCFSRGIASASSYYFMGKAYLTLGNCQDAERCILNSLSLDSENPRAHLLLGLTYIHKGDLNRAKTSLHRAISINYLLPEASYLLARLAFDEKKYKFAQMHLDVCLRQDCDNPEAWKLKGKILQALRCPEKAIFAYSEGLRFKPSDSEGLLYIAECALLSNETKKAYELIKRLPFPPPSENPGHLDIIMKIFKEQSLNQELYDDVKRIIKLGHKQPELLELEGNLNFWKVKTAKTYQEALKIIIHQTDEIDNGVGELVKRRFLWHRCYTEPKKNTTSQILRNPLKVKPLSPYKESDKVSELVFSNEDWNEELNLFKKARELYVVEAAMMALYTLGILNQLRKKPLERFSKFKSPTNIDWVVIKKVEI